MNRIQYNNDEQEYYKKKEKLRQEAISNEMIRLNKINTQIRRKIVMYRISTAAILLILFGSLIYILNDRQHLKSELFTETIFDTIWLKSDTVFLESQVEKTSFDHFYSIQLIAYVPGNLPDFDSVVCLNVNQYSINDLYGLALGMFKDSIECKKYLNLIRKAGNKDAMMVEIKNKRRVRILN